MKFAVDPWDPSYGASLGTELGASTADVADVADDVEVEPERWRPLDPAPDVRAPPAVLFVDGVRRIDAQVWVEEPRGEASPALCASYAAGVVCCGEEGAHLVSADVRRGLFSSAPGAEDVVTGAGTYRVTHTGTRPGADPMQVLSQAVQHEMGATELVVAATAREQHGLVDDLLVVDGPLPQSRRLPRAVGFVKTHRSEYLSAALVGTVAALGPGQRTPVFRIGSTYAKYTWYLRLPCPPGAPWAGVVRVECSAELPVAAAVALAACSQVTLVRYASTAYKDSRAPQNLYPIGGLERALRRRLGEPALLYRALRSAAARTSPVAG